MKFVTYRNECGEERAGWLQDGWIVDMQHSSEGALPSKLLDYIANHEAYEPIVNRIRNEVQQMTTPDNCSTYLIPHTEVSLCAPLPQPASIRDFYAFEQHVTAARAKRGLPMIPEWYDMPVFYFTNHKAVIGPDDHVMRPRRCERLDFELEMACVIGKAGRDIPLADAHEYIFGYTIMNDWSARDIQAKEVKVGLGPAKGKDFATSLGPYIVTKDELDCYRLPMGSCGLVYDLEMTAEINGIRVSCGNFRDIYYTFEEMIQRASEDATLFAGDVIGSGTVGSGCLLELGEDVHRWLEPGDEVMLEITGIGRLRNKIIGPR